MIISEIKNPGQALIEQIRQAYLAGSMSVDTNISPEVQKILNQPTEIKPEQYQIDPKDQNFLQDLIKKLDQGLIKLFTPSSLLNQAVYDNSTAEIKAKADYDILTLLHKIRQIKKLWDDGDRNSYQIINLAKSLRLTKEGLESLEGDIFII